MMSKRLSILGSVCLVFLVAACEENTTTAGDPPPAPTMNAPPAPPLGTDTPPSESAACAAIPRSGKATEHAASITGNETWTAKDSPHLLPFGATITGTLTIEPCAEVLIGAAKTVTIRDSGKLVAEGVANKPIHIGAQDASKPFAQFRPIGGGTMRLAYTTIDGGGEPLNSPLDLTGTIFAQGADQNAPTQATVFVDHVTLAGSKSNGITLMDGAGFAPGSRDFVVTGAAKFPISIWARAVGTVPTGRYTGNADDEILMPANGGAEAIHEDATMFNRGVPYHAGNSVSSATFTIERQLPSSPGLATLTIEAGVKVRMKKGGIVRVQRFVGAGAAAQGALVVNGTAAEPVVFTSAEPTPAAGDWFGIWYGMTPAANNKMDYARIEFAGKASGSGSSACNPGTNDAALRILGLPANVFVTNTNIVNSAGHGIDRGWSDTAKLDFLPTNTFTSIAACNQSYPRDTNGSCPNPVPCPTN